MQVAFLGITEKQNGGTEHYFIIVLYCIVLTFYNNVNITISISVFLYASAYFPVKLIWYYFIGKAYAWAIITTFYCKNRKKN